jgi:hypothetical protein
VQEIGAELRASLSTFRRESGADVDRIAICSDAVDVSRYVDELGDSVSQDCTSASVPWDAPGLVAYGAARIAAGQSDRAISLIPPSLASARGQATARREVTRIGLVAASLVLVSALLFGQAVYQRTAYIQDLADSIARIEPTAQRAIAKRRQLNALQSHLDRKGTALELIVRYLEQMPDRGMNIVELEFASDDQMTVKGRVVDMELVYDLADTLREQGVEAVPEFARAEVGGYASVKEHGRDVYQFEILLPFVDPDAEEETVDE